MEKQKLATGIIQEACDIVGVTRPVYYEAVKRKKKGIRLSRKQIQVLAKVARLEEAINEDLKLINNSNDTAS